MDKEKTISEIIKLQRKVDHARRQYELGSWMDLPLTMAQLKSLFFISHQGSTHSGKLAAALGTTPTNVTGIIDRLVKQELVVRAEDAQDRRILSLQVTSKAAALLSKLRERRRSYLEKILSRLNEEELEALLKGLGYLARASAQEGETGDEHD